MNDTNNLKEMKHETLANMILIKFNKLLLQLAFLFYAVEVLFPVFFPVLIVDFQVLTMEEIYFWQYRLDMGRGG
jgi:hypothetical protein